MNPGDDKMLSQAVEALTLRFGDCEVLVCCPRGASHRETGQPCQDACLVSQHFYRSHACTLLAVADGHGSKAYTRSDVGASLATEAVRDASIKFLHQIVSQFEADSPSWRKESSHFFRERFGRQFLQDWRKRVVEHASENPDPEFPDDQARGSLQRYGSTVAMALLFQDLLFVGAIGDSLVYTLQQKEEGLLVQRYFEGDTGFMMQETDSLCSEDAANKWKSMVLSRDMEKVDMLLLTTDGMSDSLQNPEESIRDMYEKTLLHGMEWLCRVLPDQLYRWSDEGVGDDMGVIVCLPKQVYVDKPIPVETGP